MKKSLLTTKANSRRNFWTSRRRLFVGLVLVLILLGYLIPKTATYVAQVVVQPVLTVDRWVRESQAAIPSFVRSRAALEAERNELEATLARSAANEAVITTLQAENASLRQQLQSASSTRLHADIITQPPFVPYDRLVLNRGARDGVVVGAPVFAAANVVIGTIIATTPGQSIASLVTSAGVESTVYVFGPDIYTTAVGQGGGVLRIGVPQGVTLSEGNPVTIPAAGQSVIGSISHIETEPSRPEQFGYVPLPIALKQLRSVTIGTDAITPTTFTEAREVVDAVRQEYFTVPVPEGVLIDIAEQPATTTATGTTPELPATTTATSSV